MFTGMRKDLPLISIVVPCRNERGHIEQCVRSALAQRAVPGKLEVIVADGMSDDGTRDILARLAREDERLRVIDNAGGIVSTGLNAAVRASRGEVVLRMDVHTRYARDYVCACWTVLHQSGADNVGGPARTEATNYIQAAICAAYHSPFSVGGARFHNVQYEGYVDTVTYGCWRRQVFDRIGFFDEDLVRNQDDEFNLRLTRAGGKIWQSPRIRSWYQPRPSLHALFRQYMQYGYWKVRVIRKHKIPASWRHVVPGSFVFSLLVLSIASAWSSLAMWAWTILACTYAVCNLAASLITASRGGWKLLPILPLVFACYHFGYGFGFLSGVIDFIVLRRKASVHFTRLTRAPGKSYENAAR
jgi:succinoglycan biosynthesis protein ExoA